MLRELRSLKLKLVIVILAAILVTAVTTVAAVAAGVPTIAGAAAGVVLALACAQLLARGTTAPLREMAAVASALAAGEQVREVQVTTADEIGELAVAFNRMTAQLAETDRLRRDVIANVSHELRTPLGALQATLENVVEGVSEPDPRARDDARADQAPRSARRAAAGPVAAGGRRAALRHPPVRRPRRPGERRP